MASSGELRSLQCDGAPYSNDIWRPKQTRRMRELLGRQKVAREQATAIVVGSGVIPYSIGYLGVSRIAAIDRHDEVLDRVRTDHDILEHLRSWTEYYHTIHQNLSQNARKEFEREFRIATSSNLMLEDFEAVRAEAAAIEIETHQGDVIDLIPELAASLRDENRQVTLAYLTNVAQCLLVEGEASQRSGYAALAGLVSELPLVRGAVIGESGPGPLDVSVLSKAQYLGHWGVKAA